MKENVIQTKSFGFALKIISLHLHLSKKLREFELSSQILKSGTSIGANVEEALGAVSKKDFIYKLGTSYKEARETKYWIRLLRDSNLIDTGLAQSLLADCEELLKILRNHIQRKTDLVQAHAHSSPARTPTPAFNC